MNESSQAPLTTREVFRTWIPLAASWLFMAAELPLLSAIVARLADPQIHLAAYGGLVFPVALIIESPIIMLLAASTALCKDLDSYKKINRFMMWAGGALTLLHILIAFTPVYYFVARKLIGAPEEIIGPARIGLMIMTPWTWSIAHRRFHQGVLIRYGRSDDMGWGTLVRLLSGAAVLAVGYFLGDIPGIIVATSAVAVGVIAEMIFVYFRIQPILRTKMKKQKALKHPLTYPAFFSFYIPLAMTPFFELLMQPINASGLSRMPLSLESLAVWPSILGLNFLLKSQGIAFNEVVVALIDRPNGAAALRKFTIILSTTLWAIMFLLAVTPLGRIWFEHFSGLKPDLASYASKALLLAILIPGLGVWLSWFQGQLVHAKQTRTITEAVIIYVTVGAGILILGVKLGNIGGLYVCLIGLSVASLVETLWQYRKCRKLEKPERVNGKNS